MGHKAVVFLTYILFIDFFVHAIKYLLELIGYILVCIYLSPFSNNDSKQYNRSSIIETDGSETFVRP
jgi:hypothetical protein